MAGGNFDGQIGKTRPGTYINYESEKQELVKFSPRGTVLIPLKLNWGPVHEFITITSGSPDNAFPSLGYSVYESDPSGSMLLLREALKLASKVIFYRLSGGVEAAVTIGVLEVKAKHQGTRGNALRIVITENPIAAFDVTVFLGTTMVFQQSSATKISDLTNNDFVTWGGAPDGVITATAGATLTGGTDTEQTNADVTGFLDASEIVIWNAMAFPFADTTLQAALKTKITYFRDEVGKKVSAVAPQFKADYEGIIGVSNGVVLLDDTVIDETKACAWVAAADAAAGNTKSNTYLVYDGAKDVSGKKTNEQAIAAINGGLFFFSAINGAVVVEYDINTLTSFTVLKSKDYRKNRVRRVLDSYDESLQRNFPPNKFDNSPSGWDLMCSLGKQILLSFREVGAIKDVDLDKDFLVDQTASVGDETYIKTGICPTDSAEKIYITVKTR